MRQENADRDMSGNNQFGQFVKFILVGVSNTIISEGIYAILVFFKVHYLIASFIGFSASVLNAYYWSSRYVFKEGAEKRIWWKVLAKTYLAYLWGYLVSAALLVLWIDIIKIGRWMEPLGKWFAGQGMERLDAEFCANIAAAGINLLITVPMNFLVNKYWAYGKSRKEKSLGG